MEEQSLELRSSPTPSASTISVMVLAVIHIWRMTMVVSTNLIRRLPLSLSQVSYRKNDMLHLHPLFLPGPFNTTQMAQDVIAMSASTRVAYQSMVTKSLKKSTNLNRAWERLTGLRVPTSRRAVSQEEWRKQQVWRSCRPALVTCLGDKTSLQRVKWRSTKSSRDSSAGWAPIRSDLIQSYPNLSTLDPVSSIRKWKPALFNSIE